MYCEEELSWGGKGASVGYMSKVKGGKNVKILKAPLLLGKSKGASVLLKFFFLLLNPRPSYEYVKKTDEGVVWYVWYMWYMVCISECVDLKR